MKILAIICEFNPFHNGHKYLLETALKLSDCDRVLCIMSGNFTQRGEMCIADKYTRARHAVSGGADCVIQLPAPFAVAPAEIFASGAIKILSAIPDVHTLAFGCESGTAEQFMSDARMLIGESVKFKNVLEENLSLGESYIRSYSSACTACGGNAEFTQNPNNILGLEYSKAILKYTTRLNILPVKRIGSGYNDAEIAQSFSSASAIRNNLKSELLSCNVPPYVLKDLKSAASAENFEHYVKNCLFMTPAEKLKEIYGCGEGLENKLKSLENRSVGEIISMATSKRYSSSRIRRILCANALGLTSSDTEKFLDSGLYIKPLAVKKERADEMLSALSKSAFPLVTGLDAANLSDGALQCFQKDLYEMKLYNHINTLSVKDYMTLV